MVKSLNQLNTMKVRKFNDNEKFVVTSSSTCLFFANTYREVLSKKFSIHFLQGGSKKNTRTDKNTNRY